MGQNYSFIKQFLGSPSEVDVEALRHENEQLKHKVEELQTRLDEASLVRIKCEKLVLVLFKRSSRREGDKLNKPSPMSPVLLRAQRRKKYLPQKNHHKIILSFFPKSYIMGDSRYSFSLTTFSPSGKLLQIEHALTAVSQGVTTIGIKGKETLQLVCPTDRLIGRSTGGGRGQSVRLAAAS